MRKAGSSASTTVCVSNDATCRPGNVVRELPLEQIPDHSFGFRTEEIKWVAAHVSISLGLQREESDLRAVAVRHDQAVLRGDLREHDRRELCVVLRELRLERLPTPLQRIAAECGYHEHDESLHRDVCDEDRARREVHHAHRHAAQREPVQATPSVGVRCRNGCRKIVGKVRECTRHETTANERSTVR